MWPERTLGFSPGEDGWQLHGGGRVGGAMKQGDGFGEVEAVSEAALCPTAHCCEETP